MLKSTLFILIWSLLWLCTKQIDAAVPLEPAWFDFWLQLTGESYFAWATEHGIHFDGRNGGAVAPNFPMPNEEWTEWPQCEADKGAIQCDENGKIL